MKVKRMETLLILPMNPVTAVVYIIIKYMAWPFRPLPWDYWLFSTSGKMGVSIPMNW